jgi:hypothetical protein
MTFSPSIALGLAAMTASLLAIGGRAALAQQCTGPFVSCAYEVKAQCSRDPGGEQRFTFTDAGANWMRWETCVGRIFEANGQRNPYKMPAGSANAGQQATGPLTVPYTEMIYPFNYGRD